MIFNLVWLPARQTGSSTRTKVLLSIMLRDTTVCEDDLVKQALRACLTRWGPSVIRSTFVDCRSLLIDQEDSSTLSTACNWKSQCRVSQTRTLIGPGDRSSTWTEVLLRPLLLDTASSQVVLVKQALSHCFHGAYFPCCPC